MEAQEFEEILEEPSGRLLGWVHLESGKIVPNIRGAATDEEDAEEGDDESEGEDTEESEEGDSEDDSEDEDGGEGQTFTQDQVNQMMSKEKKDGRRSGRASVLKDLGFKNLEEARKATKGAKPQKAGESEESEEPDRDQETSKMRFEGRVMRSLIAAGAPDNDRRLSGLMVMLDLDLDDSPDDEEIRDAVKDLMEESPGLFGKKVTNSKPSGSPRSAGEPGGKGGRRTPRNAEGKGKALMNRRHPVK